MSSKRPRRLDLNAPLLSTRRQLTTTTKTSCKNQLIGSSDRVPFSWEQSPGKPKHIVKKEIVEHKAFPLAKPPPICFQKELKSTREYGHEVNDVELDNGINDDGFSDAIDLFSLAESLNTWEEEIDEENDNGGNYCFGSTSPNFMMQRFLPAPTALAVSSLSALANGDDISSDQKGVVIKGCSSTSTNYYWKEGLSCVPRVARETSSLSKRSGFEILLPWRAKHRLCGVKSPVRRVHSFLKPHFGRSN